MKHTVLIICLLVVPVLLAACGQNAVEVTFMADMPAETGKQAESAIAASDITAANPPGEAGEEDERATGPAETLTTPGAADAFIERTVTSKDILTIAPGMTYEEIYELLGDTLLFDSPNVKPAFFTYIVDGGMRYTQMFAQWTDECALGGNEILAKVMEENTEIAPCFADPEAACEGIKPAVFGSSGWRIVFANDAYVYAMYSEYGPYILRYNIIANSIDRALNIKGPGRYFPYVVPEIRFTTDGRYMIFNNGIFPFAGREFLEKARLPFPAMYVYRIDFDESRVELLSDSQDGWSAPDEYNYEGKPESQYKLEPVAGWIEYESGTPIRLSALDGYALDSGAVTAIDEDSFAVMLYPPGRELDLGYYSFAVVNVREDRLLGICAINEP